jgi:DNA polymerase-3 subunit beta
VTVSGEISVDAGVFGTALARATGSVRYLKQYPILQCVRLEASGGEVELRCSDLDAEISVRCEAEGELPALCIDSRRLTAVIGAAKDRGRIKITVADNAATVAAGRSRSTLATLATDGFPELSREDMAGTLDFDGRQLARIIKALICSIPTNDSRPYLNGIFFQGGSIADPGKAGSIIAVATDGHKMMAWDFEAVAKNFTPLTLPTASCLAVSKLFDEAQQVAMRCGPERIELVAGSTRYLSKLVAGTYPDWRRVLPTRPPTHSYEATKLLAAVKSVAAAVQSDKTGKGVKLIFGEDETTLQTREFQNPAFTGQDACPHSKLDDPGAPEIGVNAEYLQAVVESLNAETIQLSCDEDNQPIVLTSAAADDRRACIMPTRI